MILEQLLNVFSTGYEINLPNEEQALNMFRFLHEAVLDSHLYISKAIGFSISVPDTRPRSSTYIARHSEIADSYPELMRNIQDKVFLTTESKVTIPLRIGENTLETTKVHKSRVEIPCRYTDPYVCRTLSKMCTLNVMLALSNGYNDMRQNSKALGNAFFPLYTYFHLGDYVRILPPREGSTSVVIRYYNGFTPEDFKYVLETNLELFRTRNMKEETRKWMLSFVQ